MLFDQNKLFICVLLLFSLLKVLQQRLVVVTVYFERIGRSVEIGSLLLRKLLISANSGAERNFSA